MKKVIENTKDGKTLTIEVKHDYWKAFWGEHAFHLEVESDDFDFEDDFLTLQEVMQKVEHLEEQFKQAKGEK